MAANDKSGFWNDWKTKHPRWHQLLVLELTSIAGLVIGFIWLRGADIWLFWSENRDNVRDLLFALAAPVALITAGAALRQASIAGKRHLEQTNADRERRITDSFTKAVELLGKPELEVRVGAIYALERIARESKRDHWPIMETLTAYVRNKAPAQDRENNTHQISKDISHDKSTSAYAVTLNGGATEDKKVIEEGSSPKIAVDIQSVLTVIGRRTVEHEEENQRINLSGVNVNGAYLRGAKLSRADLSHTCLIWADLFRADLSSVNLGFTDLTNAVLAEANLKEAYLGWADLTEASLTNANLTGAYLFGTNLRATNLRDVKGAGANLEKAELCKTTMPDGTLSNRDCPPDPAPPAPSETPPTPN